MFKQHVLRTLIFGFTFQTCVVLGAPDTNVDVPSAKRKADRPKKLGKRDKGKRGPKSLARRFKRMDKNGDGQIQIDELGTPRKKQSAKKSIGPVEENPQWLARRAKRFQYELKKFDGNKDGVLSEAEFGRLMEDRRARRSKSGRKKARKKS